MQDRALIALMALCVVLNMPVLKAQDSAGTDRLEDGAASRPGAGAKGLVTAATTAQKNYPKLPLSFERRSETMFVARGEGYRVDLGGARAAITLPGARTVGMEFLRGRQTNAIAERELPGRVNYLIGNDSRQWRLGLRTYERVRYREVYPGVDVLYYGNQKQLEFDLVLKPGADVESVRMRFEGAGSPNVDSSGSLLLGEVRLMVPKVTQGETQVAARYKVFENGEVGFEVGEYDRRQTLTIDPVLVYSTLLGGGTNYNASNGIAVDSGGNAYIAGYTTADDFPAVNAAFGGYSTNTDAFISKLNANGTALVYSTYIGGTNYDAFQGLAVDSTGAVWAVGTSGSSDFPLLTPYQSTLKGSYDAVVVKLSGNGALAYSTYLGQPGYDSANSVAVDAFGNAYVTGQTGPGFPTTAGVYQPVIPGGTAAFVTKFSMSGALLWSTFVGGTSFDIGYGIAVDTYGNAYVAGVSYSSVFPNAPASGAQTVNRGGGDGFVAKLNFNGSGLLFFTFIGGTENDQVKAIAVEPTGSAAVVAGDTTSKDLTTSAGAAQPTFGGGTDGFVAKLNSTGSSFVYTSYIGGKRAETIRGVALDGAGNAYVAGMTFSSDFPVAAPVQATMQGGPVSLFKTTDGGANWAAFDANVPGAVLDMSQDPTAPGTYVVSTDAGIFRTTDSGVTWTRQSTFNYATLSRSPVNPAVIYGFNCQVYQSVDSGVTWQYKGNPGCGSQIIADPINPGIAYISKYSAPLVQRTVDNGATWSPAATGIPEGQSIGKLALSQSGVLYAALRSSAPGVDAMGVYKSTDQGSSWIPVNGGLPSNFPLGDMVASRVANLVYMTDFFSLYVNTNGGSSWGRLGSLPAAFVGCLPNTLGVSGLNPSLVYWAPCYFGWGISAVAASTDAGAAWYPGTGLGPATIRKIIGDAWNPTGAYAIAEVRSAAFASKFDASGKNLLYSTYVGEMSNGNGIAVDGTGDAFVAGSTNSKAFPTTPSAHQGVTSLNPQNEVFVARVSSMTASCAFTVSKQPYLSGQYESAVEFSVVGPSGCNWTAASDQGWARILTGGAGSGTGIVYVVLDVNTTGAKRTATLSIAGQSVTLNQNPVGCSPTFATGSSTVPSSGGTLALSVTAGSTCEWNLLNNYPNAITVVSGGAGIGSAPVTLNVAPNHGPNTRTFSFAIQQGNNHTISQAGMVAPAVVSKITSSPTGASVIVTGSGCIPGTYTTPASLTWNANTNCTLQFITPQTIGGGQYTFYSATMNGGASSSTNPLTVNSGTTPPLIHANFQAPCAYTLSAPGQSFTPSGGLGSFDVTTASTCSWSAVSSVGWITILPSGSKGPGKVNFAVAASGGTARNGTIIVNGQQFAVSQQAFSCTYTIAPASGAYNVEGGDVRVVVNAPAGCQWTASSNAAWLTLASPASGTGNGAVVLRASFNPASARSGTATVAGQLYSATQAALGETACGALDVSARTTVNRSGMSWIPPSMYSQSFSVRNNSSAIIPGPVYLVLVGQPSHRGYPYDTLLMGDQLLTSCFTPGGDYLLPMSGDLMPGQTTVQAPYLWLRQTFGSINFSTKVLSGRPVR